MNRTVWLAVVVLIGALLFHATFPRYEFRDSQGAPLVRVDRWTGQAEAGNYSDGGVWHRAGTPGAGK